MTTEPTPPADEPVEDSEEKTPDLRLRQPEDPSGLKYGQEVWIKTTVARVDRGEGGADPIVVVNLPTPPSFSRSGAAATSAIVPLDRIATEQPQD